MNDGSYIDPKQETRPIQIKISFDSTEEEWRFVCAVSDVKEIKISGREDGSFDCKIKSIDDPTVPSNMVIGNVVRGRTGLGSDPLQLTHTSPVVSLSRADVTLSPEEKIHIDQPDHHQQQQQKQQLDVPSAHVQVQGDESLSAEVMPPHGSSTLQTITHQPEEHSNESSGAVIPSNATMSSHPSLQPSINPSPTVSSTAATEQCGDVDPEGSSAIVAPLHKERIKIELTRKRRHTIDCFLHGGEFDTCKFYKKDEECHANYDEVFENDFKQFLCGDDRRAVSPTSEGRLRDEYLRYIEDHLKTCPSFCSKLWKYCTANNLCSMYQHAKEGLVIYSKNGSDGHVIGSSCSTYCDCRKEENKIGKGGFGIVYKYIKECGQVLAVKCETRLPLVEGDAKLFQKIVKLSHPRVIDLIEYVSGPLIKDDKNVDKRSYLFVMPFMNQKGLDEQLKHTDPSKCHCVLEYMADFGDQKKCIFRNYLELFHQVFDGLSYLKTQELVHRDIKPSNILVQQNCECYSTLKCICNKENRVLYVLGDMGLLCHEGANAKHSYWEKMAQHDPAGTVQMRSPESFYRTDEGEPMITHKSDVWSGCVTMMIVLVSKVVNLIPHKQISAFLKKALTILRKAFEGFEESCQKLEYINRIYADMQKVVKEQKLSVLNNEMATMSSELQLLMQLLHDSNTKLKEVQSFQGQGGGGGYPKLYKEDSPLAGILSTVYVANSLHWTCLSTIDDVYDTELWECVCETLKIIAEGVRIMYLVDAELFRIELMLH
ncbi:uncharacterized protein [Dysidea avara]|uniref:uncharacterized protein isoform X2 n=1 Tax=Dysidea avara TaxID=196820 RepID=UPI00331D4A66